jgi:hypothetical protein
VQSSVSGPLAVLIASLPAEEVDAIKTAVEPAVAPFHSKDGLHLPSMAVGVSARS